MSQQKDGGYIYKNNRKEQEKHPDVKGEMTVNGVEYWVAGWNTVSKKGNKVISIALTPKDEAHAKGMAAVKQATQPAPVQEDEFFDDDIPF